MEKLEGIAEQAGRVLDRMTEILQLGWTQNSFARRPDGVKCDPDDPEASCWCLHGARIKATVEVVPDYAERAKIATVVSGALVYDQEATYRWNDKPERTLEEVLAVVAAVRRGLV